MSNIKNFRIADPGEFTRRALENGNLDLTQVEGLADLIESETEAQRRLAIRSMDGALSSKVQEWRKDLIRAVSLIEATIDFADEDIPTDVTPEVLGLINKTQADIKSEIKGSFAAERIREGFEIAIVGPPNIGKSTLLNLTSIISIPIVLESLSALSFKISIILDRSPETTSRIVRLPNSALNPSLGSIPAISVT